MTRDEIKDYALDEVPKGWHKVVRGLLGIVAHHMSRFESLEWSRKKSEENSEEPPSWVVKALAEFPDGDPARSFKIYQIKEKFGGLRFYYGPLDDYIDGAVSMAEAIIWETCQICGEYGEASTEGSIGWIETLCNDCRCKKNEAIKEKR